MKMDWPIWRIEIRIFENLMEGVFVEVTLFFPTTKRVPYVANEIETPKGKLTCEQGHSPERRLAAQRDIATAITGGQAQAD